MSFAYSQAAASEDLLYSVLFPGWGQTRIGHYGRGALFSGGEVVSLVTLVVSDLQYDRTVEQYERAKDSYLKARYIGDAVEQYRIMNEKWNSAEDLNRLRNIALGAAIGIWAINIADMIIDGEKPFPPITLRCFEDGFAASVTFAF